MASTKNLNEDIYPKSLLHFLLSNSPAIFTSCSLLALFFLVSVLGRSHDGTETFSSISPQLIIVANSSGSCNCASCPTHLASGPPENRSEDIVGLAPPLKDWRWKNGGSEEDLAYCDLFDGRWVVDELNPSYPPGLCPFLDESFDCFMNGRKDSNYTRLRWQPKGCTIPRLDGQMMLKILMGKRLAFVGDSLNRQMFQSLLCMLRSSLPDKSRVYEITGKKEFKSEGYYAFRFIDYNCTIEYFRTGFLVQEWEATDSNGNKRETLRLDLMDKKSAKYKDADVLVFNTGHWWTHQKTSNGENYYQEGRNVHRKLGPEIAYLKALNTWARWVEANIDPNRTRVFFRGFSSNHFSGGKWNAGGTCYGEMHPITDDNQLRRNPPKYVPILESVIEKMRTVPVGYLNVTRMTAYRKDGHPSVYRDRKAGKKNGRVEDCSHWCLPGVPDTWNELLYVMLWRDHFSL